MPNKTNNKRSAPSKKSTKTINSKRSFSKTQLTAFVLVFAAIGGFFLYRSFAAAPVVAILQGEAMQFGGGPGTGNTYISDSSASGGQAARLAINTSLNGYVTIPSNATSMTVIARGSSCSSGWPWLTISIDGNTKLPITKVASTSWKSYTSIITGVGAGSHFVGSTISNNGLVYQGCSRHLDVDSIIFYGPDTGAPPPATPPPPGTPPATPPPASSGTVGIPYTCNGRVNGLKIVGTGHGSSAPALINLASGCTGSLSFDMTSDDRGDDCVKVQGGAHDLSITSGSCVCTNNYTGNHQDGIQVQGGTNVVFHNVTINCPTSAGAGAFYIDGKDFPNINGVICDGCNLRHYVIPYIFTGPATNSGVRNSVLHMSPYQANRCYSAPSGTVGMVNSNNTCVP